MSDIPSERQSDVPMVALADVPVDAVILDVREQNEFDAGHAPNAVHIPIGELPERLGDLPDDTHTVAVTCRGGGRAGRAVAWLTQQGFDVANLEGGMLAWQAADRPMVGGQGTGDGTPTVL